MKTIPVILICYNRPQHTSIVLKALQEHNIQNLIIFSDAAKTDKDVEGVVQTRKVIEGIKWTKPDVVCQKENQGLAKSILSAVNYVFEKSDRLILLEDDCVPQKYFFDYMEKCLTQYEDNEKIFGMNGYTVPIPVELLKDYPFDIYFYPRIGSWGWATWKRAWEHYDPDLQKLYNEAIAKEIDLTQGGVDIPAQVQRFLRGELRDVWTLNWVLAVYSNYGFYIYPIASHIANIGCDGSGIHSGKSNHFPTTLAYKAPRRFAEDIIINVALINNYNGYFGGPYIKQGTIVASHSPRSIEAQSKSTNSDSIASLNPIEHKSLSIVHINTHDGAGGAAKVAWRLIEAQRNIGHNSRMLVGHKKTASEYSFSFPIEIDPSIQIECQRQGFLYYEFQGSHKLINHSFIKSADIVHLHNLHGDCFNPFSLPILSQIKTIVWTLHDMQAFTGHCAHSFDCEKWLTGCGECSDLSIYPEISVDATAQLWKDKKLIYEHSHLWIVTPSQWLKNKVEQSILKDQHIELIYNGIDTNIFKPHSKKNLRKKLNIPDDIILIGCVAEGGVLTNPWKGGSYTLSAIKALKERLPNCIFINIGASSSSNIPFIINIPRTNNEDELAMLYSGLDILLFTSLAENCPLVILEALACGVPIVTFATGGVPELLRDGLDGFVVGYKDTASLIEAIMKLANEPTMRNKFSMSARERAVSTFDHKIIVQQYENLYSRCIDERRISKIEVKSLPLPEVPHIIKTKSFMELYSPKKIMTVSEGNLFGDIDVSIIIATKNRAQMLDEMLASIKHSVGTLKYEVICIEGNSTDNTIEVLRKHGVTQIYDETEYLGEGRHSWPQLYNFGFSKAKVRWGMYASDDIVFEKNCLVNAVTFLDSQKSDVAGGIFFYRDIYPESPDWGDFGICFTIGQYFLMNYGLIRMDFFREVQGLDENYKFYQADADLSLKAAAKGKYFIPLPESFLIHRHKLESKKKLDQEYGAKDTNSLIKKWQNNLPVDMPFPHRLMYQEQFKLAYSLPQYLPQLSLGIKEFWHGISWMQKKQYPKALEKFIQAINTSCNHWIVFWYLAEALLELGNIQHGKQILELVIKLAPDFNEARELLAKICASESHTQTMLHTPPRFSHMPSVPNVNTKKTLVIQVKYGGLGDHLFYSHLPRIAKQKGAYGKVYISNQSEYRHADYKRLIWEMNPYIDGFCDEPGFYPEFAEVEPGINILDKIMLLQGLDDGKRFHEPELYFKPEIIPELTDKTIYDPNFISYVGELSANEIRSYFRDNNIVIDYQMKLRDKSYPMDDCKQFLESTSLEHFCSIIVSCKHLYCLASGTATLASALDKPATVFYGKGQKTMFHHSKRHKYIMLSNFVSKDKTKVHNKIIDTHSKQPIPTTQEHPSSKIYGEVGYFRWAHPQTNKYFYANWGSRRYEYLYVETLLNEIKIKNKQVVDIGIELPTDSNFYRYYVNSECYLTAFDPDGRLQLITHLSDRCLIFRKSAEEMDLPDNSVNVVVSISTFEHMPLDDFLKTVKETHRILKDNGHLIITIDLTYDQIASARWAILEKTLNRLPAEENDLPLREYDNPLTLKLLITLLSPYFYLKDPAIKNQDMPIIQRVYSPEWNVQTAYAHIYKRPKQPRERPLTSSSSDREELRKRLRKFRKIVIWGLKSRWHTHRFIHDHFFTTLKKIGGIEAIWIDDWESNQQYVEQGDLVIGVDVASDYLPIKENVYYCLHNIFSEEIHRRIPPSRDLQLLVYTNMVENLRIEKWDAVTYFDINNRVLYQPWATDLPPEDFEDPVSEFSQGYVFWVGSIWNDEKNQGNINEIQILYKVLLERNIKFVHIQGCSDSSNVHLVRASRIAPTIGGRWQEEHDYLPCRMWKNISYGQLGFSNIKKFYDVFEGCIIKGNSISELVDTALSLPLKKYRDIIYAQQEIVQYHTYIQRWLCITKAFERIENV